MELNLEKHWQTWKGCEECGLCGDRLQVCLYRGDEPPIDVLFIGEAPGPREDEQGEPFVGPSGQLLDAMLKEAKFDLSVGFTNSVACFPNDDGKIKKPTKEQVSSCWPRLAEILTICQPQDIVYVGKTASQESKPIISGALTGVWMHEIVHPAYLLRRGRKGTEYTETIRTLEKLRADYKD